MSGTRTVTKTLVIENVGNHDTVAVSLDINVECNCTAERVHVGSYTDVSPPAAGR